ncbi:hypothetical protein AB0M22_08050 [Nocardia sp. NPDC051756]|uniref:hypothetical protein n=1 Tax=Nocardia sp. NPDC051756 TaxID=3154751 RepID=UPI003445553E
MRKFTIARPKDGAARDISAATSSVHAEQHALHRHHGGRLAYEQAAARELLLLAASTVVRIR